MNKKGLHYTVNLGGILLKYSEMANIHWYETTDQLPSSIEICFMQKGTASCLRGQIFWGEMEGVIKIGGRFWWVPEICAYCAAKSTEHRNLSERTQSGNICEAPESSKLTAYELQEWKSMYQSCLTRSRTSSDRVLTKLKSQKRTAVSYGHRRKNPQIQVLSATTTKRQATWLAIAEGRKQ